MQCYIFTAWQSVSVTPMAGLKIFPAPIKLGGKYVYNYKYYYSIKDINLELCII